VETDQHRPTTPADAAAAAAATRDSSGGDSRAGPEDEPSEQNGTADVLQLAADKPPGCIPAELGSQHSEERPEQANMAAASAQEEPSCSPAAHGVSSQHMQDAAVTTETAATAAPAEALPPPAEAPPAAAEAVKTASTSWYGCQPSKRAAAPLAEVLAGVLDHPDIKVCNKQRPL
jgi:hypothetical protein